MIYIKINGKLKTLKDLAIEYNLSRNLLYGRYSKGIRDLKELTQPKYEMVRK